MMLSSYDPHTRYRDRAVHRLISALVFLGVIAVSGVAGFWFGNQFSATHTLTLQEQVKSLNQQIAQLQEAATQARAEAQIANTRFQQIQEQYNAQMPEGPIRDLSALVREQLNSGMDPQRLAFVIQSARPPSGCTDPETKRFVVSTPANKGPDSTVSVAEGGIVIRGTGTSARNEQGKPEAWYDPAQPVVIVFKGPAGEETKKGPLPIQHSIIAGDREYRFTVEEGARSFAKVTFDSCAYP